jgi:mono/diheme cytochrome c family protein
MEVEMRKTTAFYFLASSIAAICATVAAPGVHSDGAKTMPAMLSLAWRLDDQQVADVLTYIRNSWGNAAAAVEPGTVTSFQFARLEPIASL